MGTREIVIGLFALSVAVLEWRMKIHSSLPTGERIAIVLVYTALGLFVVMPLLLRYIS